MAQNKINKSVAEKIMMAISLKYIGLIPYTKIPADCSAGSSSFSVISARHKVI